MWSKCSSTIARSWPWRRPIRRRAASSARCSRTSSELMWRPPIAWSRETPSVDSWSADERRSTPEGTGFAPSPILAARSLFSPRRVPVLVDWSVWRDEFPTFRTTTYLNTCSLAPLAVRVRAAHERFLDEWEALGASAWYELWISALDLIDAYQGTGQLPTDVHAADIDVLVTGGLKWLPGGTGIAFLYVRTSVAQELRPTIAGWFGNTRMFDFDAKVFEFHEGARRFELGTTANAAVYAANAGLDLILEIGVDRLRERTSELVTDVIERLSDAWQSLKTA